MAVDKAIIAAQSGEQVNDKRVWIHVEFTEGQPVQWTTHGIGIIEAREKLDTVRADMWEEARRIAAAPPPVLDELQKLVEDGQATARAVFPYADTEDNSR